MFRFCRASSEYSELQVHALPLRVIIQPSSSTTCEEVIVSNKRHIVYSEREKGRRGIKQKQQMVKGP